MPPNRATVIGARGVVEAIDGVGSLSVDGVQGRVLADPDSVPADGFELVRRHGRPGTADDDVLRIGEARLADVAGRSRGPAGPVPQEAAPEGPADGPFGPPGLSPSAG